MKVPYGKNHSLAAVALGAALRLQRYEGSYILMK